MASKKNSQKKGKKKIGTCPSCRSNNLQIISEHHSKGYNKSHGCCGLILFGPLGLLCGLSDVGKGETEHKRMCIDCGETF